MMLQLLTTVVSYLSPIRPLKKSSKITWSINLDGALNYDVLTKPAQCITDNISTFEMLRDLLSSDYLADRYLAKG